MALVGGKQQTDPEETDPTPKDDGKSDEAKQEETSTLMRKLLSALERQQKPGSSSKGEHLDRDTTALSTIPV